MSQYCPNCANKIVPAKGSSSAKFMIVGEYPGDVEYEKGYPFAGPAGYVLRTELARVGLDFVKFRIANLWLHDPPKGEDYNKCFQVGYNLILDDAKNKSAILLVGSDVVETFTNGYKVSEINGLRLDQDDHIFSCQNVMAMINPAIVFRPKKGVGEVRFAIEQFEKMLKEEGLMKNDQENE